METVHDLHVWPRSTTETALTAHLVRGHPADTAFYEHALHGLRDRFGVKHATLQVETGPADHCPNC